MWILKPGIGITKSYINANKIFPKKLYTDIKQSGTS